MSRTDALAPRITAIGTAVPRFARAQSELADWMAGVHGLDARGARRLHALYQRSRIERRHTCIGDFGRPWREFEFFPQHPRLEPPPSTAERMRRFRIDAADLAVAACHDLERAAGRDALAAVDHLFVATCTGLFAPGLDVHLARALGLRPDVGRTIIGFQGCQAGLTAMRLAENLCRSRSDASALVVCVELCTLHFQSDPTEENLLANALFADGAAAVLIAGADAAAQGDAGSGGGAESGAELRILGASTHLQTAGVEEMVWSIGDAGFLLHLAPTIPDVIARAMPALLPAVTRMHGDDPACWPIWAVHPGGAAILDRLESTFGLPSDRLAASRSVLRHYGNMSSATIHFVLRRILDDRSIAGCGVAVAFGPGISVEVVALEKVRRR